jgi:FixJ family two-component response regulator
MDTNPVVYVVDDDSSVRNAITMLLEASGFKVETSDSAQAFLERDLVDASGCLVLDVQMEGLSGLDLQQELTTANVHLPIIFITGHGDVPMSVQAMKAGAVEFLTKPFREQELLSAVRQAVARESVAHTEHTERASIRQRYEKLTPREKEVMALVAQGLLNKQIALKLSASEGTIKIHRGHVMLKMQAGSIAALVRMADKLSQPDNQ